MSVTQGSVGDIFEPVSSQAIIQSRLLDHLAITDLCDNMNSGPPGLRLNPM